MDVFARVYRSKNGVYDDVKKVNGLGIGMNSHTLLIIKLPNSWLLRVMSRSLLLAMLFLTWPSICSVIRASLGASFPAKPVAGLDTVDGFKVLPILLRDLVDEGLVKRGHRGFVSGEIGDGFEFLGESGVGLLNGGDLERMNEIAHQVFDFMFVLNLKEMQLIDGILKDTGLVIMPMGNGRTNELKFVSNYKIVYVRKFEKTMVAMRKAGAPSKGLLYGITPEEKKAALKGLEDVYLEPPRRAPLAEKPSFTSRKIKFLPDLLKDSLNEYPRRVFVSDDSTAFDWFYKNYPMRDQEFDVYKMDVEEMGVSAWLRKSVRREEYVVMKAEAQVVEEMVKEKSLYLVDELFLECKNQWEDGEEENGNKRAYWQCLELYGKVKDEGIAVHQWWN
ncbi:hypothetical protein BUALT_Bualt19G0097300 [Buddleja alternifolia]|uniref:DUF7870 domain-containing protein n=1 Tax=Buddleja alternifolia TaxID=168488 RepID=A0AAV6W206_9LAMI|nr:hypothetical protein BUALT_Bualt19G0097300 [Buddleja alternifolia]